jgi:hypothetical protein
MFLELFLELHGKIGFVNISKTIRNCFQYYLEILSRSKFPGGSGNGSRLYWKLFMHLKCFWGSEHWM